MSELLHTPSLIDLMERVNKRAQNRMFTGIPGIIQSYDFESQTATVKPAVSGKAGPYPVLTSVPVIFPGNAKWAMTFPLDAGDSVWILFSHQDIDGWLSSGLETPEITTRRFDLSDAVCIPGLNPSSKETPGAHETDLVIGNADIEIRVTPDNKIKIGNSTVDIVNTLRALVDALIAGNAGGYPLDPVTQATLAQMTADLQTIEVI